MAAESRFLRKTILALVFFALAPLLWAQAAPGIFQRLSWVGSDYVFRFEVIIEKEEEGTFRELFRGFREETYIYVSLSPGRFRYRVIPRDFLDRPGPGSPWMNFDIRAAVDPVLHGFSPPVFYLDGNAMHELTIFGNNLSGSAQVFLRRFDGVLITPSQTYIHQDGRHGRMLFGNDQLTAGEYEIVVINPGGLETSRAGIAFSYPAPVILLPPDPAPDPGLRFMLGPGHAPEYAEQPEDRELQPEYEPRPLELAEKPEDADEAEERRPRDVNMGLAWMPLFPILGESQPFGREPASSVGAARLAFILPSYMPANPGLEFATSWHVTDAVQSVAFELLFFVREWLPNGRMALNLRLGAGFSILTDNQDTAETQEGFFSSHATMGLSFLWLLGRHFFMETGIDYIKQLIDDHSTWFRPWIGIGWRHIERLQPPEAPEAAAIDEIDRGPKLYAGFAWMPLFPINAEKQFLDTNQAFFAGGFRMGFVSSRQRFFNHGLEFALSWYGVDPLQSITMDLNLLAQRWMPGERLALNLRLGAGVSLFPSSQQDAPDGTFTEENSFHINTGLSFLWLLGQHFFVETGIDYVRLLSEDLSYWIRPWVGAGWRLNQPAERAALPALAAEAEQRRPPDVYAGIVWMPPIFPIYGESRLPGGGFRMGFVSTQERALNLGLEFAVTCYLEDGLHSLAMDLNFLVKRWLVAERMALNVRLGAGVSMFTDRQDIPEALDNAFSFNTNIGLSFRWLIGRQFFAEAGFEYVSMLSGEQDGWVRPWVGMGWRL